MKSIAGIFIAILVLVFTAFGSIITVASVDIWEGGCYFIRSAAPDNRVYYLNCDSHMKKETLALILYAKQNNLQLEISFDPTPDSRGYHKLNSARVNFPY